MQRGSHLVVRADVDYYSVLGVDKNADKKAIKQAYRCIHQADSEATMQRNARSLSLAKCLLVSWVRPGADQSVMFGAFIHRQKARKYHPDVNKEAGAEETFKQVFCHTFTRYEPISVGEVLGVMLWRPARSSHTSQGC